MTLINAIIHIFCFMFKGLEVAAFGVGKGGAVSVHAVGQSPTPFTRVFGPAIGKRMTQVWSEFKAKSNFNKYIYIYIFFKISAQFLCRCRRSYRMFDILCSATRGKGRQVSL